MSPADRLKAAVVLWGNCDCLVSVTDRLRLLFDNSDNTIPTERDLSVKE